MIPVASTCVPTRQMIPREEKGIAPTLSATKSITCSEWKIIHDNS